MERQNVSGLIRHDSRHGGQTPAGVEITACALPPVDLARRAVCLLQLQASLNGFGPKFIPLLKTNKEALSKHRASAFPSQQHFMQQKLLCAAVCVCVCACVSAR